MLCNDLTRVSPHANGEPLVKLSFSHSHSFLSPQRFCLLSWSTNDDGSALTSKASLVPRSILQNDDAYRCDCVTVIVVILRTNRARCASYEKILDLLNKESVSGARSDRASL